MPDTPHFLCSQRNTNLSSPILGVWRTILIKKMFRMSLMSQGKTSILKCLEKYRQFLFACRGYTSNGIMPQGVVCSVEDPTEEMTHHDVVHPCVRYIKEGFEGHKWWMVYTPYYAENDTLENPRLCYADSTEGELPKTWHYYCTVINAQKIGYNSDPTMLFHHGQLYVFWRECGTPRTKELGCRMMTVGCKIHQKETLPLEKYQLFEYSNYYDREVSPTFLIGKSGCRAYAMHIKWNPDFVYRIPVSLARKLYRYKIIYILDALGLCDLNTSCGVSIWDADVLENTFHYMRTVQFENMTRLYQPWHMDVMLCSDEGDTALYAIVQTRQRHARICLAKSLDGQTFRFIRRPLMTSKTAGMVGLYKSSAVKVDGKFYLFYTSQDNADKRLHRLSVSTLEWNKLLNTINKC